MNNARLVAPLFLLVTSCGGSPTASTPPLAGARIGGPFALVDQSGRTVTDHDFAGSYRIMYFGYTFCPDVCPADVGTIGAAMRLLDRRDPRLAQRVVPIFVSVDPRRDTPAVLKQFVGAFYPRMVGLTGSDAAVEAVTHGFGVYRKLGKPAPGGGYLVDHGRQTYLMDPAGKPLALLPTDQGAQAVADEIVKWAS